MILSKEEICHWANTSDSKRNFKEGDAITIENTTIYFTIFALTRRKTNSCNIYLLFLENSAATQ